MPLVPGINVPEHFVEKSVPFWIYLAQTPDFDRDVLESLWAEFDRRLRDDPLRIHYERLAGAGVRVVEIVGLLAFRICSARRDVSSWAIEADGSHRRIGRGFAIRDPFQYAWWMRFVFQRFAPHLTAFDFVGEPLYRPATIELDTARRLTSRLHVDRRFWQMRDAFRPALGLPQSVFDIAAALEYRPTAENLTKIWQQQRRNRDEV